MAKQKETQGRKGFVFTIDVLLALLITFVTFVVCFSVLTSSRPVEIQFVYLRTFSLDTMAVMEKQGYLADAVGSVNETNTTSLRSFVQQTPPEICMHIEIYDTSGGYMRQAYSLDKTDCDLAGEDYQVAWRSFATRNSPSSYKYYLARLTSWYKQPVQG